MALKTLGGRILHLLPPCCPFLLGPILFGFEHADAVPRAVIYRYGLFLALFSLWEAVQGFAFTLIRWKVEAPQLKDVRTRRMLKLSLVGATLLMLVLLEQLNSRVPDELFWFVLLVLGFQALRRSFAMRGRWQLSQLMSLAYLCGAGYLSFYLVVDTLSWPPFYVALGCASLVLAHEILLNAQQKVELREPDRADSKSNKKRPKEAPALDYASLRPVPLLFVAGPTFVGIMVYMNILPPNYLLVFATLLVSSRIATKLRNSMSSNSLPPELSNSAAFNCVLFVVIILGTKYLL